MLTDITTRADASLPVQYVVDGSEHVIPLLLTSLVACGITVIIALVASMQSAILYPAVVLWGIVVVQVSIALLVVPPTLFGHWKDDHFKEKLEWDSFAHFLSDLAMIQKYAPEDLSMWGEWLVYGTALGVGKNVEQAMKSLNIHIADIGVPVGAVAMNAAFIPLIVFMPPSRGGGGDSVAAASGEVAAVLVEAEGSVAAGPGEDELRGSFHPPSSTAPAVNRDFSIF